MATWRGWSHPALQCLLLLLLDILASPSLAVLYLEVPPRPPRIHAAAPSGVAVTAVRLKSTSDEKLLGNETQYTLHPSTLTDQHYFAIDEVTGDISTNRPIDRAVGEQYRVIAVALYRGQAVNKELVIAVTEYNRLAPELEQEEFIAEVGVWRSVGSTVMTLRATDLDPVSYNRQLYFFLSDAPAVPTFWFPKPKTGPLEVRTETGEVVVRRPLTLADSPLQLTVGVADGGSPQRFQTADLILYVRLLSEPEDVEMSVASDTSLNVCWHPPRLGARPVGYLLAYSYSPDHTATLNLTQEQLVRQDALASQMPSTIDIPDADEGSYYTVGNATQRDVEVFESLAPVNTTHSELMDWVELIAPPKKLCTTLEGLRQWRTYMVEARAWTDGGRLSLPAEAVNSTTRINHCAVADCGPGTCRLTTHGPGYSCICPPGTYGRHCHLTNPCLPNNPCKHLGECRNGTSGSFTCDCLPGYYGATCSLIDPCIVVTTNPCINGGTCVSPRSGAYECVCAAGFFGATCEKRDPCVKAPCFNGADCKNVTETSFNCICQPGYTGDLCEEEINECKPRPCQNGGYCKDHINDFECFCPRGWAGKTCDIDIDSCEPNTFGSAHGIFHWPITRHGQTVIMDCPYGIVQEFVTSDATTSLQPSPPEEMTEIYREDDLWTTSLPVTMGFEEGEEAEEKEREETEPEAGQEPEPEPKQEGHQFHDEGQQHQEQVTLVQEEQQIQEHQQQEQEQQGQHEHPHHQHQKEQQQIQQPQQQQPSQELQEREHQQEQPKRLQEQQHPQKEHLHEQLTEHHQQQLHQQNHPEEQLKQHHQEPEHLEPKIRQEQQEVHHQGHQEDQHVEQHMNQQHELLLQLQIQRQQELMQQQQREREQQEREKQEEQRKQEQQQYEQQLFEEQQRQQQVQQQMQQQEQQEQHQFHFEQAHHGNPPSHQQQHHHDQEAPEPPKPELRVPKEGLEAAETAEFAADAASEVAPPTGGPIRRKRKSGNPKNPSSSSSSESRLQLIASRVRGTPVRRFSPSRRGGGGRGNPRASPFSDPASVRSTTEASTTEPNLLRPTTESSPAPLAPSTQREPSPPVTSKPAPLRFTTEALPAHTKRPVTTTTTTQRPGAIGARRQCLLLENGTVTWSVPDFSACQERATSEAETTASKIASLTNSPSKLNAAMFTRMAKDLAALVPHATKNPAVAEDLMAALSNMLAVNASVVAEGERAAEGSTSTLRNAIDTFTGTVKLEPGQDLMIRQENLVVKAVLLPPDEPAASLTFRPEFKEEWEREKWQEKDRYRRGRRHRTRASGHEVTPLAHISASQEMYLELPEEALKLAQQTKSRLQFVSYKNDKFFQGKDKSLEMPVITAILSDVDVANLTSPVVYYMPAPMRLNNTPVQPICVFWQERESSWDTEGIETLYTGEPGEEGFDFVCHASHLTSFSVLLDPIPSPLGEHEKALALITYVGLGISTAGLVATIVTYVLFRSLGRDGSGRIVVNLCLALLFLNTSFLCAIVPEVGTIECVVAAAVLHYTVLAAFCWMLVEAVNMYHLLITVFASAETHFLLKRIIIAWGLPAVVVIATLSVNYRAYGDEARNYCVIAPHRAPELYYGAYLGPICFVLLVNCIVFVLVTRVLCQRRPMKLTQTPSGTTKEIPVTLAQVRGAFTVMALLGVTWSIGAFSFGKIRIPLLYIFCIANSLQGFIIFTVRVLQHPEARNSWCHFLRTGKVQRYRSPPHYSSSSVSHNHSSAMHTNSSSANTHTTGSNCNSINAHSKLSPSNSITITRLRHSSMSSGRHSFPTPPASRHFRASMTPSVTMPSLGSSTMEASTLKIDEKEHSGLFSRFFSKVRGSPHPTLERHVSATTDTSTITQDDKIYPTTTESKQIMPDLETPRESTPQSLTIFRTDQNGKLFTKTSGNGHLPSQQYLSPSLLLNKEPRVSIEPNPKPKQKKVSSPFRSRSTPSLMPSGNDCYARVPPRSANYAYVPYRTGDGQREGEEASWQFVRLPPDGMSSTVSESENYREAAFLEGMSAMRHSVALMGMEGCESAVRMGDKLPRYVKRSSKNFTAANGYQRRVMEPMEYCSSQASSSSNQFVVLGGQRILTENPYFALTKKTAGSKANGRLAKSSSAGTEKWEWCETNPDPTTRPPRAHWASPLRRPSLRRSASSDTVMSKHSRDA